ncbi:hypothetical protein OMAG_001739 [Candidatus Omnitrophus magneticus]|uniref:Uncharacterized protein n=1 Tax=Candidatus Omnitrophus magneticus TaxID=1609969 RepID=A0A0F0CRZ5_9BACT|nr:hypothetical protein OMAG_001739 [Candidatus Omnitrophus magneticus]
MRGVLQKEFFQNKLQKKIIFLKDVALSGVLCIKGNHHFNVSFMTMIVYC